MKPVLAAIALAAALILPFEATAASAGNTVITQPALAALPVVSRDFSVVNDRYIRIGDLFENAGETADITVAYAPRPGKRAVFDARWLYRVAKSYKLKWRPRGRQIQVVVTRQSSIIEAMEIADAVKAELANRGVEGRIRVQLASAGSQFHVTGTEPPLVRVENLNHDVSRQRFTAVLVADTTNGATEKFRISGHVYQMVEIPVLSQTMRNKGVIRSGDIEWISYRADRIGDSFVREAETMIGMSPRRILRARTPVREADLRAPVLVARRSMVIIHLQTPILTMTAQGRALENGALGQMVRVMNSRSNKTIEAVVTGPNTVSVTPLNAPLANRRLALK